MGSLGSKFIFTRGGEAEAQGMRLVGTETETGVGAKVALVSLAAGLLCASAALLGVAWRSGALACSAAAALTSATAPAVSAAAATALLLPAARVAAALGAAFLCGGVSFGALRAAMGWSSGAASTAERERFGPGGRRVKKGISAS